MQIERRTVTRAGIAARAAVKYATQSRWLAGQLGDDDSQQVAAAATRAMDRAVEAGAQVETARGDAAVHCADLAEARAGVARKCRDILRQRHDAANARVELVVGGAS